MNKSVLIVWGYLSEVVLATMVLALLLLSYGSDQVASFLKLIAQDFAMYFFSIIFASSIAFLWTFYSKSDTPFSKWLFEKGAFKVYLIGYIYAVAVNTVLLVLLLLASKSTNKVLLLLTTWVLLMGIINIYTFFRNVIDQLLLNMTFNHTQHK